MNLQLLRNASLIIKINNMTLLVDPMLAPKNTYPPINNTGNSLRNPLVDLPVDENQLQQLITGLDGVLLTHIHNDHWDEAARQMLPNNIHIFCQPENADTIRQAGFTNVIPVYNQINWQGIDIIRTGGQHGTNEIGKLMGIVSGYVIRYNSDVLYIAGDTIWCKEVQEALDTHKPTHIILNGGGARFTTGDPIVMDIDDIINVCKYILQAKVYVVHLEAVNHSVESRVEIRTALRLKNLSDRCLAPGDGEWFI